MRVEILTLLLTSCGPAAYTPRGILAENDVDPRTLHALGCVEVAFGAKPPVHDTDAALLIVRVGNTCVHPAPFDLRAIRFTAVDAARHWVPLSIVDPRDEIAALHVDSGVRGVEKVRLRAPSPVDISTLCIDLGSSPPFCLEVPR